MTPSDGLRQRLARPLAVSVDSFGNKTPVVGKQNIQWIVESDAGAAAGYKNSDYIEHGI